MATARTIDVAGSILRIDVDQQAAGKKYAIPKDNPFVSKAKAQPGSTRTVCGTCGA
jgi:hypothetical protein